jgi:hypothetical protein
MGILGKIFFKKKNKKQYSKNSRLNPEDLRKKKNTNQ